MQPEVKPTDTDSGNTGQSSLPRRRLRVLRQVEFELPMFLPVYQPSSSLVPMELWVSDFQVEGCIINAYFLYKQRALRKTFEAGLTLREYVDFDGLLMTDSGAFQGFTSSVLLKNKNIVRFQDAIGTDVCSPLDLVTPPGDSRRIAEDKMKATLKRVEEAKRYTKQSVLAGVQQGGRFLDLRQRSMDGLIELDCSYIALGSLVPFFNRNHDLGFVGEVIKQARLQLGPKIPIHVYGAGDPVELPFFWTCGADIFDSSSYGHYAQQRCYMTPYGALRSPERLLNQEYVCQCKVCVNTIDPIEIFDDVAKLAYHNLAMICQTIRELRQITDKNALTTRLDHILERHQSWFLESKLQQSWEQLN